MAGASEGRTHWSSFSVLGLVHCSVVLARGGTCGDASSSRLLAVQWAAGRSRLARSRRNRLDRRAECSDRVSICRHRSGHYQEPCRGADTASARRYLGKFFSYRGLASTGDKHNSGYFRRRELSSRSRIHSKPRAPGRQHHRVLIRRARNSRQMDQSA